MEPKTREFNSAAAAALKDPKVQRNLHGLYNGFHRARIVAAADTPDWEELRERGRAVKAHTIEHLDYYLERMEQNVIRAGGEVYFAKDAEAATQYVVDLAHSRGVKVVIKSKSMLSEEMGLNHRLTEEGIEPVETDLGEYIIQLADETPFHIIAPAIHKSREDVSKLFQEKLNTPYYEEIEDLTREARNQLREKFIQADMGITGANFLVAETGTVVLVTNEGNGRMCTSMPRIHVAIVGMEKVIPSVEDLGMFLRLLIRSATGQRISSYITAVNGTRRPLDEDGPEEFHLVIVDNGRSRLLSDPELRESLYCLRCGACLNACPVYRKVGGTRLRLGIPRPHWSGDFPYADPTVRRQRPPLRFKPMRCLSGGLPGQDKHSSNAALPPQGAVGGREVSSREKRQGHRKAGDQGMALHSHKHASPRPRKSCGPPVPVAPPEIRPDQLAPASTLRLDPLPDLSRNFFPSLQKTLEQGRGTRELTIIWLQPTLVTLSFRMSGTPSEGAQAQPPMFPAKSPPFPKAYTQ